MEPHDLCGFLLVFNISLTSKGRVNPFFTLISVSLGKHQHTMSISTTVLYKYHVFFLIAYYPLWVQQAIPGVWVGYFPSLPTPGLKNE